MFEVSCSSPRTLVEIRSGSESESDPVLEPLEDDPEDDVSSLSASSE